MSFPRAVPLFLGLVAATALTARADDLRVELVTATEQPLRLEMQISGTIEALDSVETGFRQGGRVVEVVVEEGDRVSAGQPLARLDPVQLDQALNVAEASLASALAARAQARQASDRAEAMLARGVGTRAARDAARQALSEAEGAVERTESLVDQARRAVEDTVLRAPEAAIVTSRLISPGQIVAAAQPALTLAGLEGLEAVFRAPDQPALRSAMGQPVRLRTLDIDRPEMTGTVTEIAPLVDPQTGTVLLRALIAPTTGGTALLGAAVRGFLEFTSESGVALPWTALMREGEGAAVWIVDDQGRVSLAPVQISHFGDGTVFLSGGVVAGQTVVAAGSQLLYPGRRVLPAEPRP